MKSQIQTPFKPHYLAWVISLMSTGVMAEQVTKLDTIIVTANKQSHEFNAQQQDVKHIAGGTNFIAATELSQRHVSNLADVFEQQSGIYAQSAGNEGSKISIRGSGINRAPGAHASGTFTQLDGIALTGPGGTPYELLEPWWIDAVSVYRGANGFQQGALALGGAINYHSPTGQLQQGSRLRAEIGSYGAQKYMLSTGQKMGDLDYYFAVNHAQQDGFQDHAATASQGIMLNMGYQVQPNIETRIYARYRETEHQTPGRIRKSQLQQNDRQANSYNVSQNAQRIQPGSTWLANQTTWQISDQQRLDASLSYHQYPMDLQESPYRLQLNYSDITAQLNYSQHYEWAGKAMQTKLSLRSTEHRPSSVATETLRRDQEIDGQFFDAGTVMRRFRHTGSDQLLQLDQHIDWNDRTQIQLGLAGIYTERALKMLEPEVIDDARQRQWHIAPRLGLIYNINNELQAFAHLSRSIEPAHPWSMIWGSNKRFPSGFGAATGRQSTPVHLKTQMANSFEIGGRGDTHFGQWQLSYYYSDVKNELLSTEVKPENEPVYVAESNASATIHQGLEASLKSPIYQWDNFGKIYFNQAYTWSDFHYKHDANMHKNELAGIPTHYYQAKLGFEHFSGWSIALNTEYASKMPVDYANSVYSDAYQIWGLQMAYEPLSEKWQAWLEVRNLSNEIYASTVTPGFNDAGLDAARYTPGQGFATYAGVEFKF